MRNGNPIDGTGVMVAVIDTGVQLFHPDLAANISPTLRFNCDNGTNIVSPEFDEHTEGFHGTAVAGIIGAVANNGVGGTGVAPGVTLVPIKADRRCLATMVSPISRSKTRFCMRCNMTSISRTTVMGPGGRGRRVPLHCPTTCCRSSATR